MAASIFMRRIRTYGKRPDFARRAYAVLEAAEEFVETAKAALYERQAGWEAKDKAEPDGRVIIAANDMVVSVFMKTNTEIWERVSVQGREPGPIYPRVQRALSFPFQGVGASYIAHTTADGGFGGPGTKMGDLHYFKMVNHPGFEARHFEEKVQTELLPEFRRVIRNALRREPWK